MTKILIIGKNGQIANALIENFKLEKTDFNISVKDSSQLDFSDPITLKKNLENIRTTFNLIINCAGYTNVDKAEEEQDLCDKINHQSVKILANFCNENKILLIHYSTDYVFDGSGSEPFSEDNTINLHPVNFYGKTKLLGEQAIQKSGCDYIIIRLSWVYDNRENSKNFVNTIKRLAKEKEVLNIVNDQIGSPTSADFVARNSMRIFNKIFKEDKKNVKEIIHLNNGHFVSLFDFSLQIFEFLKRSMEVINLNKIISIESTELKNLENDFAITKNSFLSKTKNSKLKDFNIEFLNNLQNHYATIFAHYDKDQIIDDYVIYYLENLRKISDYIIFVSDSNLPESETAKIQNLCHKIIAKRHNEYDFGSYKIGIELFLNERRNCNNLILANDSCFGPIKPFENIFQLMEFSDADFWGLITNQDGFLPHLQSYFLIFKERVISSKEFAEFFKNVKKQNCKEDIIKKYEVGLTQYLLKHNFKMDSFVKKIFESNPTESKKNLLYADLMNFPIVKIKLLKKISHHLILKSNCKYSNIFSDYKLKKLINNYFLRNNIKIYNFKIFKIIKNNNNLIFYLHNIKILTIKKTKL